MLWQTHLKKVLMNFLQMGMVLNLMRATPIDVHLTTEAYGKTRNIRSFFRAFRVIPWLFIMRGP
jgi:hypothetical protein